MFDFVVVVLDALLDDGVVARCHFFEVLVDRFAAVRERREGGTDWCEEHACEYQSGLVSMVLLTGPGLARKLGRRGEGLGPYG